MVKYAFHWLDYVIIAITMIASVGIGIYFRFSGGKQKTNAEYLLADRNMSILPVAVSLMASFMSAVGILGTCAENYYYGMQFMAMIVAYAIGTPIITQLYLPVFFNLQKTSAYEYLELRFGLHLRLLVSLTYTLQTILYNGIVLYAPSIVLETVTGMDRVVSILVVGGACTCYSAMGGMKAVLYTDLMQSFLMIATVTSVLIFSVVQVGGFGNLFTIAAEGGRVNLDNFSLDPVERHTWWSLAIGGLCTYLSLNAVNQIQVQRLLTVSTLGRSQACMWWSWPVLTLIVVLSSISGLGIYAVYKDCDPLVSQKITGTDQLMPYYVVNEMKTVPGLAGLFVAGIFSASLSTISAACNSLAAITICDYVNRWCKVKPSHVPWLTKLAACAYGLVFLGLAFLAEKLGGLQQASLTIFGAVGGPILGVFTLGMFTTCAREGGAAMALITGVALNMWMSFGGPRPVTPKLPVVTDGCAQNITIQPPVTADPSSYFYLYRISYMWTSLIGFVWVLVMGSAVSLAWRQQQPWQRAGCEHPDPALFTPPLAKRLRAGKTPTMVKPEAAQNTSRL